MNFPLAQITDYEALEKISFERVEAYLLKKGWKGIAAKTQQASAWKSPDKSTGVLVSKTREVADYSYRIGDCIRALAAYEKRSEVTYSCRRSYETAQASHFIVPLLRRTP